MIEERSIVSERININASDILALYRSPHQQDVFSLEDIAGRILKGKDLEQERSTGYPSLKKVLHHFEGDKFILCLPNGKYARLPPV